MAAAGGPGGLLNMTRLLAAQDLAKGNAPASMSMGSAVGSEAGSQQGGGSGVGQESERKVIDTPQPSHDSLLKVITC